MNVFRKQGTGFSNSTDTKQADTKQGFIAIAVSVSNFTLPAATLTPDTFHKVKPHLITVLARILALCYRPQLP